MSTSSSMLEIPEMVSTLNPKSSSTAPISLSNSRRSSSSDSNRCRGGGGGVVGVLGGGGGVVGVALLAFLLT